MTAGGGSRRSAFTSREIALLGLMSALWGVIEITVGGMIKSWHVPFGGAFLSAFGVVILLTARAGVPRRWSSLLVGLVAAGIRFASGFGGAVFASVGIAAEALIVEAVLSLSPPGRRARLAAGILAVIWSLAHPFVVQGYIAGLGPAKVYAFTIGLLTGGAALRPAQVAFVILFLLAAHAALGVGAVMFVDRILLAPYARFRASHPGAAAAGGRGAGGSGGTAAALTLVALLACSARPAAAQAVDASRVSQQPGEAGAAYTLPELSVFGSRLLGPYAVFRLESSDIQEAGGQDLSDALRMVPGMVVRTDSRGEARLSTRGLAERELVVLIDGVPISDPYTGSVSSSMVLSGALGSVSVTKGPAASVYGANALGGVVEVTTADAERSGLGYRLSAGSDGRYSGHLSGGGRVGGLRLSGGVASNGGSDFTLPASYESERWEDGGRRDHSRDEELFAWGRAAWRPASRADASLSFQVADGRRDVPASTSASRPRFWRFPYWREVRTVGGLALRPRDDLFLETKLFYGTNDNELAAYSDFDRTDRMWLSSVSNRAVGGYFFSEYRGMARQRLSCGLNVRGDFARLRSDIGEDWRHYRATTSSVFAQDVLAASDRDRVSLAVNTDLMAGEERFLARVNPQAAWTHRLPDDFSVRLLAGLKTRFPTLKEWFSPEIGNPDLRPERSSSIEVELSRALTSGSRFSLLAFRQRVEDMIVTSGVGHPAQNLERVGSWGAELGVEHRPTRGLGIELSLAMTSARDLDTNLDVPLVPRTVATLMSTYRRGPADLLLRVTRVGSRRDTNAGTLEPYVLVDARASVATAWGDVFAGVANAFDVLYEDEDGFPQPGRTLEVGIARELFR